MFGINKDGTFCYGMFTHPRIKTNTYKCTCFFWTNNCDVVFFINSIMKNDLLFKKEDFYDMY